MKVKSKSEVAQSYPTLRDPMDCSLPGSSIHGIFQARVLEWGAIAFFESNTNKNKKICYKLKIYVYIFQRQKQNIFSDEQKPKQFITSRLVLQSL